MDEEDLRTGASNFLCSGFEDMLLDEDRNSKYRKAIESAVRQKLENKEDAHVLDIGSGTGLLSFYALTAGATSVTSIELDPVIFGVSRKIAKKAGFVDRIRFINAESLELDCLPQKANIFVSEIVDSELLGENILRTVRHALEFLTTPDVVCIPARADVFVVPIESSLLADQVRLPEKIATSCGGHLCGIDSHWLTSGRKNVEFACQPLKLKSFTLNDINSLSLESTTILEFNVQAKVKQIDGVLLWWHLDLAGDGQLVISTGSDHGGPRWRNHWLQVAYGFSSPVFVHPDDKIYINGSHDEVSFWFDTKQPTVDFLRRRNCMCQWHSIISPSTLLSWNTVYEKSGFVKEIIKASLGKTVLCFGTHSQLPLILTAKKILLIESDTRFCAQISKHCLCEIQFVHNINQVNCWNEIDIAIFDVHSSEPSSPVDFARNYFYVQNTHKEIKLLPEKLELKTMPMKFANLWRRKMRVTKIDEFDYSDFDRCFSRNEKTTDDDLELLPLWEERCFTDGDEQTLFPSTNNLTNIELSAPNGADAFVFWFASTMHRPFKMLDEKEVEWDRGTRQWIYFLTNSTTIKVEFKEQQDFPRFTLIDSKN